MRKHWSSFLTNRACAGITSSCKDAQPMGHMRPTHSPEGPLRRGPPASSTAEDESSWSSHRCWREWDVAQHYIKLVLPNEWDIRVTCDVVGIQNKHVHMCAERHIWECSLGHHAQRKDQEAIQISMHFPGGSVVKNLPAMQETCVQFLGWEHPLEEEMATHASVLAWEVAWTEEPGWVTVRRVTNSQMRLRD